MTPELEILRPVVALAVWTMIIWAWMYATRIPAIQSSGMVMDSDRPNGEQMSELPAAVRWKADNYNHLLEQPTLFYAVAITLALLGAGDGSSLVMAWAFVALRVVHSLVQTLGNKILVRFGVFALSSLVLIGLIFNAVCAVF